MKRHSTLIVFILIVILYSCKNNNTFDNPLPNGTASLQQFPERFKGHYGTSDNQTILSINDKDITLTYDYDMRLNKGELPPGFMLQGDTLIEEYLDNLEPERQLIHYLNDSEFLSHEHYTDTVFRITDTGVLKVENGYCFLNDRIKISVKQNTWEVRKISLQKGLLIVSFIENPEDINKLPKLTESADDTMSTFQFSNHSKELIENRTDNKTSRTDTFYRINEKIN